MLEKFQKAFGDGFEVPEFAVVALFKFVVVAVVSDGRHVRGSTSVYRCSHLPPDQLDLSS